MRSEHLSDSEGTCPLHTYNFDSFKQVPDLLPVGARLLGRSFSAAARPLILGRFYTIADASTGVVAKATMALHPEPFQLGPQTTADWMPDLAQTWFAELQVPSDSFAPIVNDNAFLDFCRVLPVKEPRSVA
ncbi:MAG: hypothetical protein H6714_11545 [Myxococcales bacterium]|nr:hypothetical protein [Myxococcales bacterium]